MFEVKVIRSSRRTCAIEITGSGEVVFRCNYLFPESEIRKLIKEKEDFINKHLSDLPKKKVYPEISEKEKRKIKKELREYVSAKADEISSSFGLKYGRISITSAKRSFGSCNGKNDLSFSYYLYYYPRDLVDYVVAHELSHTVEHNHSKRFYSILSRIMPDWKERQTRIRKFDF